MAAYARSRLDGWTFDAETLAMARALGYRIREMGIHWSDRPGSRLSMRTRARAGDARADGRPRATCSEEAARQASPPDRARCPSWPSPSLSRRSRRRLGAPASAGTLAALFALSIAVLAGLLVRVWIHGGVVTGSDGYLVVDQLQYLNWLRQAGHHVAVANLYDLAPGPRSFVHPGVVDLGAAPPARGSGSSPPYMVWKPVAVAALFVGSLLYVRRFLERPCDRGLALVLALFTGSPVSAIVGWGHIGSAGTKFNFDFIGGELWPGTYLWGYLFTAIAVGLVPLGLLAYERGRDGGERAGSPGPRPPGCSPPGSSPGRERPSRS